MRDTVLKELTLQPWALLAPFNLIQLFLNCIHWYMHLIMLLLLWESCFSLMTCGSDSPEKSDMLREQEETTRPFSSSINILEGLTQWHTVSHTKRMTKSTESRVVLIAKFSCQNLMSQNLTTENLMNRQNQMTKTTGFNTPFSLFS